MLLTSQKGACIIEVRVLTVAAEKGRAVKAWQLLAFTALFDHKVVAGAPLEKHTERL